MYWRLAGTFLLALAVYMVGRIVINEALVMPYVEGYVEGLAGLGGSGAPAVVQEYARGRLLMIDIMQNISDMISAMLAFIVWGYSWSHSRLNRRAWLIGIIAFAAPLPVFGIPAAFLVPDAKATTLLLLLVSAAGAVAGFALGRALANRFGAGRGLQRGPVPVP